MTAERDALISSFSPLVNQLYRGILMSGMNLNSYTTRFQFTTPSQITHAQTISSFIGRKQRPNNLAYDYSAKHALQTNETFRKRTNVNILLIKSSGGYLKTPLRLSAA